MIGVQKLHHYPRTNYVNPDETSSFQGAHIYIFPDWERLSSTKDLPIP